MLVAKIHYILKQRVTAKLLAHQEDTNTLHSVEMEIRSSSDGQAGRRTTARYPRAFESGGALLHWEAALRVMRQGIVLGVLLLRCRLFQWETQLGKLSAMQ